MSTQEAPLSVERRAGIRLAIGLALAIALDTAVQVLWKRAASSLTPFDSLPRALAGIGFALTHQPIFIAVVLLIVAQMINWIKTLDYADVSFAQPITALSYASVAVVSRLWFGETLSLGRVAGMALILLGVVLVASSDPNSNEPVAS